MNRIDGNQLSQLQSQTRKAETAQKTGASATASTEADATQAQSGDSVRISDAGRQLSQLEKSMDTKAFNEQKVSLIKQSVESGTYKPDAMSIARKMLAYDQ